MSGFEFATAARIIFGEGSFSEAGALVGEFGKRVLLVTGGSSVDAPAERLIEDLRRQGAETLRFIMRGEPDLPTLEHGLGEARAFSADVVVGLGGGSAMDSAKCLAALLTNGGALLDYLEVVGKGQQIRLSPAPCICIPTTAGTGAEVTRNSVISVPEQRVKASMRSPLMLPKIALVDPELTYALPPDITAYTGLDAFTQLFEAFISKRANHFTMMLCREGLHTIHLLREAFGFAQSAPAWDHAEMRHVRSAMAYNSLLGGLALANAGLGAVHGFAAVLGARYPIPHGACCGLLLPYVARANASAQNGDAHSDQLPILALESTALHPGSLGDRDGLLDRLDEFVAGFGLPRLSRYGVKPEYIPELVQLSKKSNSMKGNPVELTDAELTGILHAAL